MINQETTRSIILDGLRLLAASAFFLFSFPSFAQSDGMYGFVCLRQTPVELPSLNRPLVYKVNMDAISSSRYDWATERFNSIELEIEIEYIQLRHASTTLFYIDRTTLEGGYTLTGNSHSCSLNTYSEVDEFVKREISKLNNTRAF